MPPITVSVDLEKPVERLLAVLNTYTLQRLLLYRSGASSFLSLRRHKHRFFLEDH